MRVACLLVAFVLVCLTACTPKQDETLSVKDWLVVPVFYATNRVYDGINGAISYSDDPNNKGLLFGVKNMVVPAPVMIDLSPVNLNRNCWRLVHSKNAGQMPTVKDVLLPDNQIAADKIVTAFKNYAAGAGTGDSIIFVHGCCANFDTSMKRAAKVAANMGSPVLLYDWVSPIGFRRYLQNETRVKQTTDDFCRFLNKIDTIAEPNTVTLLGHSMGAQFVDEALVRRAIRSNIAKLKPYREVIMSNADVDARSFLKHTTEFTGNAKQTRIYISSNDKPLKYSALAHGGYERLGEPRSLLKDLVGINATEVIDITEANTGHEIPFSILASLHSNNPKLLGSKFKLQKVAPGFATIKKLTNEMPASVHNEPRSESCVACGSD
ncbi:MAG: alpha/beta hydrolase [Candidatus Obscuribacterales bacterium]|nr:alpha/beta hydrolase [Candidatus Obscuribacterales bacterium]